MIKEFRCTNFGEAITFEKRFRNYAEYQEALATKSIVCPVEACASADHIEPVASKTAPPQFNGPGFYQTDYK